MPEICFAKRIEKNDFCKFLGNSVCLKSSYRKRKEVSKLVTGKEYRVSKLVTEEEKSVFNMVMEIN